MWRASSYKPPRAASDLLVPSVVVTLDFAHPTTRERHPLYGRCTGHLEVVRYEGASSEFAPYQRAYTFRLASLHSFGTQARGRLSAQGFAAGGAAVVSVQDGHAAVNRARVVRIDGDCALLATRSRTPALQPPASGCGAAMQHTGIVAQPMQELAGASASGRGGAAVL